MASSCGKILFAQDVGEGFSWLTMAKGGRVANVV
jgi:hypothetical protein